MIIVDGHSDSLEKAYKYKLKLDDKKLMFNFKNAKKITPYIQFMATYIDTKYLRDVNSGYRRGVKIMDYAYSEFKDLENKYPIQLINNKDDVDDVICNNKIGILLTTENGAVIGDDVSNIDYFHKKGVKVMGITWNHDNLLGCGTQTNDDKGLTNFGKECIGRMNELDIIIDISHTSKKTFWDTIKLGNRVIATHSCVQKICGHKRNLDDKQIQAIAEKEGIIGVCFYNCFIKDEDVETTNIKDLVQHIKYIKKLVGIDYVGLGSDFDGLENHELPKKIKSVKDMIKIVKALKKEGFSEEEIGKVMGGNYLRVLKY